MKFSARITNTSTLVCFGRSTWLPDKAYTWSWVLTSLAQGKMCIPRMLRHMWYWRAMMLCRAETAPSRCLWLICSVNFAELPFVLGTIHKSYKQILRLADASNFAFASEVRQGLSKLLRHLIRLTLLARKVICCQLAGLIGMEGRRSSGREGRVPTHAHLAGEQGVELTHILCWGLSKKKDFIADGPFDWRSSLGSKESRQSASSTQNLASEQIPQKT